MEVLFFIKSSECRPSNRLGSKVVELVALSFQVGVNIPQALSIRNLGYEHANELVPSSSRAQFLAGMMDFCEGLKLMSRNRFKQLMKSGVMM